MQLNKSVPTTVFTFIVDNDSSHIDNNNITHFNTRNCILLRYENYNSDFEHWVAF